MNSSKLVTPKNAAPKATHLHRQMLVYRCCCECHVLDAQRNSIKKWDTPKLNKSFFVHLRHPKLTSYPSTPFIPVLTKSKPSWAWSWFQAPLFLWELFHGQGRDDLGVAVPWSSYVHVFPHQHWGHVNLHCFRLLSCPFCKHSSVFVILRILVISTYLLQSHVYQRLNGVICIFHPWLRWSLHWLLDRSLTLQTWLAELQSLQGGTTKLHLGLLTDKLTLLYPNMAMENHNIFVS